MKQLITLLTLLLSFVVQANELSQEELQTRKIITRMYEATYGAMSICQKSEKYNIKDKVAIVKERNPEFFHLIDTSPYLDYAKAHFKRTVKNNPLIQSENIEDTCVGYNNILMLMTSDKHTYTEDTIQKLKDLDKSKKATTEPN